MVRTQKFDLDTDTTLGGNNASDYIAPSQKAIKDYVDNHSGGGGGSTDIFWCTYGTTTYDDILNASNDNKIVACIKDSDIYYMINKPTGNASDMVHFARTLTSNRIQDVVLAHYSSGDSWSNHTYQDFYYCDLYTGTNVIGNALINNTMPVLLGNDDSLYIYSTKIMQSGSSYYTYIFNSIDPINNNIKYYTVDYPNTWTAHTSSIGTVTSVNNVQPDNSGNVTLPIPQQVQSDWNETDSTSKAYIQNKPSIPDTSTLEKVSNKVTSISSSSTDTQYPSALAVINLLQTIYPVGSVYLSTNATCPLASLFGTWTLVSSGRALWTGYGSNGGTTISAGLPNITGYASMNVTTDSTENGALYRDDGSGVSIKNPSWGSSKHSPLIHIDASRSNSIYGNSSTVQPPAYVVNVWRRTA